MTNALVIRFRQTRPKSVLSIGLAGCAAISAAAAIRSSVSGPPTSAWPTPAPRPRPVARVKAPPPVFVDPPKPAGPVMVEVINGAKRSESKFPANAESVQ